MPKQKFKSRFRFVLPMAIAIAVVFVLGLIFTGHTPKAAAAVGVNEQVNYQGRLLTNTGAVVPDGSYNMEFKITQDGDGCNPTSGTFPCSGTVKWTETRESGNKVLVKNGYFSVYLGSVTPFGSSVDWNQNTLWLSINIGGTGVATYDGAMKPLTRLSSTPYAMNAKALQGLNASNFVQLAQGVQADASTTNASIFINKTGTTANILDIQKGGVDVMLMDNTGTTLFKPTGSSATAFQIQNTSSKTVLSVDTTGNQVVLGNVGASGVDGKLVFDNATNANTVAVVSGATTASYSLTLPTTGPAVSQCLQTDSVTASQLKFAACSAGGSGVTTVGAIDTQVKSVNGAVISGVNLYMQTADTTNPGLVSTTTQTFAGDKTFKSTTNSQQAFQVQNAAGNPLLNINTLTSGLNLVSNPSFEANANGWVAKGAATIAVDSTAANAQYGNQTLKITTTAVAGDGATYNFYPGASTVYSLSFWAKASASTGANISFGHRENTTSLDADCLATQTLTTTWTQYTCSGYTTNATINDSTPTIGIYIKQTDATAKTIYIDGVTLVAGATALAYVAPANNLQVDANYSNLTLNGTNTGEIQPWRLNGNGLPAVRYTQTSVSANGYVYVIGGIDATTYQSTVYYAKLNADGTTGAWYTNANALPGLRGNHPSSVVANGYVYVIGGYDGTNTVSTVYYAKLNADGSTGAWYTNANALPAVRRSHTSIVANGYVYVIGGIDATTYQSTVYYAKLNADGSTGTWITNTNALPAPRGDHSSVVANGYVYVIGGWNSGNQSTVYYAKLNADGSTGTWITNTNALPAVSNAHTSVVANGYVYVIGGNGATYQSTVYYAKLNADGSTGTWSTSNNALPDSRSRHTSVVANGYVYVIGGYNGSVKSTVYYASTARMLAGGTLDLVGLGGQALGDVGTTGGSLTAGNTTVVGTLDVRGDTNFTQNVTVNGNLAAGSTTIKNLQNSTSILQVQSAGGVNIVNINTINQIGNSDFESGTVGTTPDGWTAKGSGVPTTDNTQADFGVNSMKVVTTTAANDGAKFNFPLLISTQYTLSLYAKVGTGSITDFVVGRQDIGSDINCLTAQTVTTTWTRFTCTFTTGSSITGTPNLYVQKSGASAETFFIDGVQLEQAAAVTNFREGDITINGQTIVKNSADTISSLQVQNAVGNQIFTVDATNKQVVLGKSSGVDGTLQFVTSAGVNSVSFALQANPASSYTLLLPTTGPAVSQCLQTDSVTASQLKFAACAGGSGVTTVGTIDTPTTSADGAHISGTTIYLQSATVSVPGLVNTTTQSFAGNKTFTGTNTFQPTTNITGLVVKGTTAASPTADIFNVQTTGSVNLMQATASGSVLLASSGGSSPLTITAAAASTWSTLTGDLTVTSGGNLLFNGATGATIRLGDATNNMTLSATTREPILNGTARHTSRVVLAPEYPGGVMTASSGCTTCLGTMQSEAEPAAGAANLSAAEGYTHNLYNWTTTQATNQQYDIWISYTLPSDFSAFASTTPIFIWTKTSDLTNGTVTLQVFDANRSPAYCYGGATDTPVAVTPTTTANQWQEKNVTNITTGGCTFAANDRIQIRLRVQAVSSGNTKVGEIRFDYLRMW